MANVNFNNVSKVEEELELASKDMIATKNIVGMWGAFISKNLLYILKL